MAEITIKFYYRDIGTNRVEIKRRGGDKRIKATTTWKIPPYENANAITFPESNDFLMLHLIDWDLKNDDGTIIPCTWANKQKLHPEVAFWLIKEFYQRWVE